MLSIISTPIGNLGDITLRAIETLKQCDGIICEDTRVTGNLLKQLHIGRSSSSSQAGTHSASSGQAPAPSSSFSSASSASSESSRLISFHGHSSPEKIDSILRQLKDGKHLALVSDAGTPGISDPGYAIVSQARAAGIPIEVIPGPAAFLAALSASGLPINRFVYLGFLPLKKGRQTLLLSFTEEKRTIVFYESVHRIGKTLSELAEVLKDQPDRPVVIARELTKLHEEVIATTVAALPEIAKTMTMKGEFVIVIGPR